MNGLVKLAMHAGLATGAGALAAKLGGLRIERAPESERAADRATERLRDSERVGPTGMWASSPEAGHVASGAAGIGAAALATRAFRRTGLARHPLGALVYAAGALGAAVLARDLHRAGRAAAGRGLGLALRRWALGRWRGLPGQERCGQSGECGEAENGETS